MKSLNFNIDNYHIDQISREMISFICMTKAYLQITLRVIPFYVGRHEGDTPLPLAYCVPLYFGIAYCVPPFFASRTAYRLTTKNNHFGRFHLHKEVKITVCCMHMYSNS